MSKIVAIHSFRGGTGKSNLAANLAWLAARKGRSAAVLDSDLQSPGVHVVFGCGDEKFVHTVSEFAAGECELRDAAIDVTNRVDLPRGSGRLLLVPSRLSLEAISRVLAHGYDVEALNKQMIRLSEDLGLDLLFVDTHPGLNDETTLSAALADTMLVVIRPDAQDFHGTAVLLEVARKIGVPDLRLIANKVPEELLDDIEQKLGDAFRSPIGAVLPLAGEMVTLGSRGVFAARYPEHGLTIRLEKLAEQLLEPGKSESGGEKGALGGETRQEPDPGQFSVEDNS